VDTPAVLRAKDRVLRRLGALPSGSALRRSIATDLSTGEWCSHLMRGGFNQSEPAAMVMEGLLMYLPEGAVVNLLEVVGRLAPRGSRLGISLVDTVSLRDAQASESPLRRTWVWGCDEERAVAFFQEHLGEGWRVTHVVSGQGARGGDDDDDDDDW
jgi:methyltransferase (TIGR00027 family)